MPHKKHPVSKSKRLKQVLTKVDISVIFSTEFLNGKNKTSPDLTRADVRCRLTYQAELDIGGMVPMWIARIFCKRAYPKFIDQFIQHCHKCYDREPLQLANVAPPANGK